MIPRVGLDLTPGLELSRFLPELDLLDIAYGAAHGGCSALMLPASEVAKSNKYSTQLFARPGLPMLTLKATVEELTKLSGTVITCDRIFFVGEREAAISNFDEFSDIVERFKSSEHEVAVLVEPEANALKELARLKIQWAFFSTTELYRAPNAEAAGAELAKISQACLAAHKFKIRTALYGPCGRQFPSALASLPHLEEIYPAPDLWSHALRLGWERAVLEFRNLLR